VKQRVHAHFIGVGGAGMSGIARVLHQRGVSVSGSDLKESRYTRSLLEEGVPVAIGHDAGNLGNPEVVVVSTAIPDRNPELEEARNRGLEVWPRAKMLAEAASGLTTVAVAGTHGKTSTSAMVATMLAGMGLDPTFLVGGEVSDFGTNGRAGTGAYCVMEADESDGSFMFLDPFVAVVTNVEAEHLDHYGTLDAVERQFVDFMAKVPDEGTLVLCADHARLLQLASSVTSRIVTYGCAEDADVRYTRTGQEGATQHLRIDIPSGESVEVSVALPGEHMASNSAAAIAVAVALGLDAEEAAGALSDFGGVKRRFDHIGTHAGVTVVDDYAHHPTEVRATVQAAHEAGFARVWVVFQPHRYTRTQALGPEFGSAFDDADRLVLMDVYSAGEPPIPGVTGKTVLEAVLDNNARARVAYLPHRGDVAPFIAGRARHGDLVMTMGAGDVTSMAPEILRQLDARNSGRVTACP